MTGLTRKRGKCKVGPDGKTKHQRYLEKHRAKIYASNAVRNRERRLKKKIDDVCIIMKAVSTPREPPPRLHRPSISRAEKAITTTRESTMPIAIAPITRQAFDALKKRFERWERECGDIIGQVYNLHSVRAGWLGNEPFTDLPLEAKMYEQYSVAKALFNRQQEMLRKLSFEVTGHSERWDTIVDMMTKTTHHIALIQGITSGYQEPDPDSLLPPSDPPSDWEDNNLA